MKVTVWTLTTDGDNCPIDTRVFATAAEAYAALRAALAEDHDVPALTKDDELSDLWTELNDGACILESHVVDVTPKRPNVRWGGGVF